jgi:hypothetical protein
LTKKHPPSFNATPEETSSRIAYGVFGTINATTSVGGPLNASTISGGGNYSLPQHDDFPFGMDA